MVSLFNEQIMLIRLYRNSRHILAIVGPWLYCRWIPIRIKTKSAGMLMLNSQFDWLTFSIYWLSPRGFLNELSVLGLSFLEYQLISSKQFACSLLVFISCFWLDETSRQLITCSWKPWVYRQSIVSRGQITMDRGSKKKHGQLFSGGACRRRRGIHSRALWRHHSRLTSSCLFHETNTQPLFCCR